MSNARNNIHNNNKRKEKKMDNVYVQDCISSSAAAHELWCEVMLLISAVLPSKEQQTPPSLF